MTSNVFDLQVKNNADSSKNYASVHKPIAMNCCFVIQPTGKTFACFVNYFLAIPDSIGWRYEGTCAVGPSYVGNVDFPMSRIAVISRTLKCWFVWTKKNRFPRYPRFYFWVFFQYKSLIYTSEYRDTPYHLSFKSCDANIKA